MILPLLILISSILFLAGFLKLNFQNLTKKFIQQLKKPLITSPTPPLKPNNISSPPSSTNTIVNKDDGLKQVFDTFDKNKDGFITRHELEESLKNIGLFVHINEVNEMVEKLDLNKDGLIDLGEFQKLFELFKEKNDEGKGIFGKNDDDEDDDEENLKEAFDVFDGDKDGLITVEELGLVLSSLGLKEGNRVEDCKEMIRKVDVDGDGMVNFDEFKKMMRGGCGVSRLVHAF